MMMMMMMMLLLLLLVLTVAEGRGGGNTHEVIDLKSRYLDFRKFFVDISPNPWVGELQDPHQSTNKSPSPWVFLHRPAVHVLFSSEEWHLSLDMPKWDG